MSAELPLPPYSRRHYGVALLLTLGWTLLLALICGEWLARYYPFADEWALMANADLAHASPLNWFTRGFSDYFVFYEGLSQPYANFVRPGFNFFYWLLGLAFEPTSAARLYFNFLAIGACSGLAWLAVAHSGSRLALPLAAAVPLLPGYIPASAHAVPCLAYDPLVAALGLAAVLAYQRGRLIACALILWLALYTKETSLSVALALPLIHVLVHRGQIFSLRRGGELALLLVPLAAWIALRLVAFEDVAGGTYAFRGTPLQAVKIMILQLPRWPLWVYPLPYQTGAELSAKYLGLVFLAVVNFILVASLGLLFLWRLWRRQPLDPALGVFLASDAFMLTVGSAPRYGAVVGLFMVVAVVRWRGEGSWPRISAAVAALLVAGIVVGAGQGWKPAAELTDLFADYGPVAKRYAETLQAYPADARVLVLNDPVTWHAKVEWLDQVMDVRAEVHKIADFACPSSAQRLHEPCSVSLTPTDDPLSFRFGQSCGFDLCAAGVPLTQAVRLQLDGGVELSVEPARAPGDPQSPVLWRSATLKLQHGGVHLLMFDPATQGFVDRYVP